jgi:hypothetical protein
VAVWHGGNLARFGCTLHDLYILRWAS